MAIMKTRVFQRFDAAIPEDRVSTFATNAEVNTVNEMSLEFLDGDEFQSQAIVQHKTMKNYKPAVDPSGNIRNTNLQKIFKFKVGSKVMLTYNLKTTDGLTNGAFGRVMGVKVNDRKVLQEVHVHFTNKTVAKEAYKSFPHLLEKYGVPCVAITRYETEYRLGKENSGVKSSATAINFPLKLAEAATSHKVYIK